MERVATISFNLCGEKMSRLPLGRKNNNWFLILPSDLQCSSKIMWAVGLGAEHEDLRQAQAFSETP